MEGNINNNGQLRIETALYRCLYFCGHFYQSYLNKEKPSGVFARFEDDEALFISNICHVTLKEYMSPNRPNFFKR